MATTGAMWTPTTEAELQRALYEGLLREDHHTDYKAQLGVGEHGTKSLAIDLASFAVDGGRILIGVDEKATPLLVPIDLKGQKERIDQVAHSSRIDPPLDVSVCEIPADGAPGRGYLVVIIPPSPSAPHMVEHIYRGRADTTNISLSDGDVRRIRGERQKAERDIADLVRAEVDRDPTNDLGSTQAHLFIVAQPVFGASELLQEAVGTDWAGWMDHLIRSGMPQLHPQWSPDFGHLYRVEQRANGPAATSFPGRQPGSPLQEKDLLDVEVREDGGIRLFAGRVSDSRNGTRFVIMPLVGGLLWRTLHMAKLIAEKTGYVGSWQIGVGMTSLKGTIVSTADPLYEPIRFSENGYEAFGVVTFAQLEKGPDETVERLLGRFGRAMTGRLAKWPTEVGKSPAAKS